MEKMESYLYSLNGISEIEIFHEIFSFKAYEEIDITDLR